MDLYLPNMQLYSTPSLGLTVHGIAFAFLSENILLQQLCRRVKPPLGQSDISDGAITEKPYVPSGVAYLSCLLSVGLCHM